MNRFEIMLMTGDHMQIDADCYNTDESGNLDLMIYNQEGLDEAVATFKNWSFIRLIDTVSNQPKVVKKDTFR